MNYYAFTLKKTRKPISLSDYAFYLKWISDKGISVGNVNYEDTKGLHLHCVLRSSDKIEYQTLRKDKYGWNYKLVPIYNFKGWLKYSTKDAKKDVETQFKMQELYEEDPRVHSEIPQEYSEEYIENLNIYQYPMFDIRKRKS